MRRLACAALTLTLALGGTALAAVQTVAVVHSGSATYVAGRTIVVRATVDLPNSCWSNPRFIAPARGVQPDADGVVPIRIVADSKEGDGIMCAMIFRPGVTAPALRWRHYPAHGLTAVRLIGSRTPLVAPLTNEGHQEGSTIQP
jgi:hypothetical protein